MPLPGQLADETDFQVPRRPAPVITSLSEVDVKLDRLAEKLDICIEELSSLKLANSRGRDVDGFLKKPETGNAGMAQLTPRSQVSSVRAAADEMRLPLSASMPMPRFMSTDESDVESFAQAPADKAADKTVTWATPSRPNRATAHVRDLQTAWQLQAKSLSGGEGNDLQNDLQPIMRLVYRSRAEHVWEFLDDPQSSRFAWWTWSLLRVLVLLSACTPYLQQRQPVLALVMDMSFDVIFLVEFVSRLTTTPSKRTYLKDPLNWADMVSALGLPLRAFTGLVPLAYPPTTELETVLVFFLPLVRLLKLLRYFESCKLLMDACVNSMEAVPFLAYMVAVMTMTSATVIYLVEPRSNIPSLPHSLWLAIVTMTTVGYGDYYPETFAGCIVVAMLTCISVLFLALPVALMHWYLSLCS